MVEAWSGPERKKVADIDTDRTMRECRIIE